MTTTMTTTATAPAGGPASGTPRGLDRAAARAFVDEHLAPLAEGFDRSETIPGSFLAEVGGLGGWGAAIPRQHGGLGLDMVTLGAVHEEFGRGCSSLRSLLTVHTMVAWAISRWGTGEQREEWLRPLATGEVLASFCLSEVDAGSDTRQIATTARPAGDGWLLQGRKKWITGGCAAGLYLVFARTEAGVSGFLVPREAGVGVVPITGILGTRASMLAEVVLDGVRVPAGAHLGPRGFAPGFVMTGALDIGRYSVACGSVGIVQACLDACTRYARQRRVGGTPIAEFQLTQAKLADMAVELHKGILLAHHLGRRMDAGRLRPEQVSFGKLNNVRAALEICRTARTVLGANGISLEYPVIRHMNNLESVLTYEGTVEMHTLVVGQALTGLPAFR
jgi:alkylation response protein AidB-like acyl-CoA dehydrogenase